jgi:hypothetical protein
MPSGGYRKPPARTPPAGPGKYSRRTDGQVQPIRTPNVGDSPDLQQGDRSMLTDAQRIAGVPKAPRIGGGPGTQGVSGLPPSGQGLPPWLIDMASNRPNEPVTAGLDMGPGPGSEALSARQPSTDVREIILEGLYANYGNQQALEELQKMRADRASAMQPVRPTPPEGMQPARLPELGTSTGA